MTTHSRLNNIILIILIVAMLANAVVLAWHIATDDQRPILRPAPKAPDKPELPGAWYEKYKDHEARNLTVTS